MRNTKSAKRKRRMTDLNKLSTEELRELVSNSEKHHASNQNSHISDFLKSVGHAQFNYTKGALRGAGQTLGDIGASAINLPISGIEHLTGKMLPHVPHPNLIQENPETLGESIGQKVGSELAPFAIPGLAGAKTAQLANRGYQAIKGGGQLPLLGRLLSGGAGGALEGALGNEGERIKSAELGAGIGGLGQAGSEAMQFARSLTSKDLSKHMINAYKGIANHFGERFSSHLAAGEEAGANKFLKPVSANLKLLKKDRNADEVYKIEKFNQNPTLANAHNAQSALGNLARKYELAHKGTVQSDIYEEALKHKNRLLQKISESFEKSGIPEHGQGYNQSRMEFAEHAAPYLNNPAIAGLLGKASKKGEQTVRPEKFSETFFENKKAKEDFLSRKKKEHPELIRRERFNAVKDSPITSGAIKSSAAIAAGVPLTYAIAKALGLR
jgi:hypothetical protein